MNRIKNRYYKVAVVLVSQYQSIQFRTAIVSTADVPEDSQGMDAIFLSRNKEKLIERFVLDYNGPIFKINNSDPGRGLLFPGDGSDTKARGSVEAWFKKKARHFEHKLEEQIIWVQLSLYGKSTVPPQKEMWEWWRVDEQICRLLDDIRNKFATEFEYQIPPFRD